MSLLGNIDAFNPEHDNWPEYYEMLEQYFLANDIEDNKKRTATLLTIIGKETYSLLTTLMSPDKPSSKKADELNGILTSHFQPTPIVIAERYKFYSRNQGESENIATYVAELRKLTKYCEFKAFLDEALRDKFVCGLKNSRMRKRLLFEKDLTLNKALELAKCIEKSETENNIMAAKEISTHVLKPQFDRRQCYRCGSETHLANKCYHKETICNNCNIRGHLAKVCRRKSTAPASESKHPTTQKCHACIQRNDADAVIPSDDDNHTYYIHRLNYKEPFKIQLNIRERNLEFEIDTGSGLTIISEVTYRNYFAKYNLEKNNVTLKTYSGERLNVLGYITVELRLCMMERNIMNLNYMLLKEMEFIYWDVVGYP